MRNNSKFTSANILTSLLVTLVGLCYLGTNNLQLFDWDELNFAEISREMVETGHYLQPTVNYAPFHEKPPLFNWMQAAAYQIFGVTPAGARLPNLLAGLLTFLFLRGAGRESLGQGSVWWALFFCLSLLPALYFQSGIIDPWFNLLIIGGLWTAIASSKLNWGVAVLAGLSLGLAVLTKGPVALLIAGICWAVLLFLRPRDRSKRLLSYLLTGLVALLPMAIWVALLWREDGGLFAREFIDYQWRLFLREDAGHGGFPGYHAIVLLLGCFPAGWLALPALFDRKKFGTDTDVGMRVLFWAVLLLFSIVNTKIVHYSSLCYFPLAWFAARASLADGLSSGWRKTVLYGWGITWGLYTVAAFALPVLGSTVAAWSSRLNDPGLVSRLQLGVGWPWYTYLPAIVGALGFVWWWYGGWRSGEESGETRTPLHRTRGRALLVLTPLLLLTSLYTIVPRIQTYSQGAPVQFFSELAGQDVYVGTAYYKSYAHWYYAALPPERYADGCRERQCRFHEPITKPLYFASPIRVTEQVLREVPDARLLRQEGGFSFYVRAQNAE